MDGLISIIVPIYNSEAFLEKCVRSVLFQTYSNIEVILVNDGSTDGSGVICDRLAESDKRIRVIHKENGGTSSARNAGLDAAKGEFVGFVDSDDTIDANMYEKLHEHILQTNADMVVCSFKAVYEDYICVRDVPSGIFTPIQVCEKHIADHRSIYGLLIVAVNKLIRMSILQDSESMSKLTGLYGEHDGITENGIRFPLWPRQIDNEAIVDSDSAFMASCAIMANKGIAFLNIAPYNYQLGSNQASQLTAMRAKNMQLIALHIEKCMTAILPERAKEIKKMTELTLRISIVGSHHEVVMKHGIPRIPLSWKTVLIIMTDAPIANIAARVGALCLYLFPGCVYRLIFKLSQPFHGVKIIHKSQ